MKLFKSLLLAGVAVLACRDASVAQSQSNVYSINVVGVYQNLFPPGTALVGHSESNGFTWAAAGPLGPQIMIASNSLAVSGLAAPAGHKARLAGVNGPAARISFGTNVTSGTLYYSLALRVADIGALDTNGGTLVAFNDAVGASQALPAPLAGRLMIRAFGTGYQLGVAATSGATDSFYDTEMISLDLTAFVVCSYTFNSGPGNDVVKLWVNPNPATFWALNAPPPQLTAISSNDVIQISSFVLMQRPQPILPAVTFVDEVRVGTTWASVTPPPPPVIFAGLEHATLGRAMVNVRSNELQIRNLGTSGQDGVSIRLGRVNGWTAQLIHHLGASNRVAGSGIEWMAYGEKNGQPNQLVISGRVERTDDCLALYADGSTIGASGFLLEVLSNGVVVAQTTVNSGRIARLRPAAGAMLRVPDSLVLDWDAVAGRNYCWVRWFFDEDISGRACAVVLGDLPDTVDVIDNSDSLRISAIGPTATMGTLSRVELRGVNSGDFSLRDQAIELLDHWHRAVGGALVDTTGDSNGPPTLRVGNLGSSGENGFEVFAGGSDLWVPREDFISFRKRIVQAWPDDGETPWPTSSNSYVKWTATGRIPGSSNSFENLIDLTSFRQEQGTLLTASFALSLSPTQELTEVFNGPTLVGSFTLPVGLVGTLPSTARVTRVSMSVTDGNLSAILATRFPQPFAPADGSSALTGDRFRITALNPQATVENLRSLITRGANVESFAFRSFNTAAPRRPRLAPPRLLSGGRIEIRVPSEPDVTYDIERSQTLLPGSWTSIGRVMGTDGVNTTSFFDIFVGDEAFHRIRAR